MLQIKLWDRDVCLAIGKCINKNHIEDSWLGAYGLAPVEFNEDCDAPVFGDWLEVGDYEYNEFSDTGYFETKYGVWQIPICFIKEMKST